MKKNFLYSIDVIIFNLVVFFAILQLYFLYHQKYPETPILIFNESHRPC